MVGKSELNVLGLKQYRDYCVNSNCLSYGDDIMLVDNLVESVGNHLATVKAPIQVKDRIIFIVVSGELKFKVNWQDITLSKNDAFVARTGDVVQFISSNDVKMMVVVISSTYSFQNIDSSLVVHFMRFMSKPVFTHLTDERMFKICELYHSLRNIFSMENFKFKEQAINGIMQFGAAFACQWICDIADQQIEDKSLTHQQQLFDHFLELVLKYHMKERSVTFYAEQMCITPKYLSQIVVKVSGRYAVDWIRDQVILKAKALLRSRQYTVQQISDMLTFPNPSFFGKYFRQEVGMSPRQYMLE